MSINWHFKENSNFLSQTAGILLQIEHIKNEQTLTLLAASLCPIDGV